MNARSESCKNRNADKTGKNINRDGGKTSFPTEQHSDNGYRKSLQSERNVSCGDRNPCAYRHKGDAGSNVGNVPGISDCTRPSDGNYFGDVIFKCWISVHRKYFKILEYKCQTNVALLQNKGRKTFVSGQISEVTPYLANVVLSCVREASSVTGCSLTS